MRYLKLLVLLLVSFSGFAQAPTNYTNINGRYRWIAGMFDSTFSLPKGTTPSLRTGGSTNGGALFYRTTDSTVYYYTGNTWQKFADTARFIPYTGATKDIDLGQYGLKTKWVEFDTSTQAVTARRLQWSNDDGVLQYGMTNGATMTNRIGLEQFARVKNVDATQINKGEVVYLFGASGDRASVKKADNRQDATSSKTLGVATEDIPVDSVGFVGTFGVVGKLNLAAFTPGDILYLDSIPGQLTKTKPQAPYHLVFIGVVERANAGNGLLFVNPQNGYELEELHNVRITSPVLNKSILAYDSVRALWVDTTFSALGGVVTQVNTGTGLTGGPITGVGTIAADTLLLSTRAWRQKGIDSVQANLTAGLATKVNVSDTASMLSPYLRSNVAAATYVPQTRTITINGTSQDLSANRTYNVGTVTQVSSGVGLSGGPITTSGTLSVDTLLMSTRAWRQKGIDSVAALANTKIGGSGTAYTLPRFTGTNSIGNSNFITDVAGNLGIGLIPSDWASYPSLELGNIGNIGFQGAYGNIASNLYFNTSWKYATSSGAALLHQLYDGQYQWYTAPQGLTGQSATLTLRMTLDANGNLGVGNSLADSMLMVNLGTHLKRGVRMSGLPTGAGTKAVRINANGTLSVADTLANGVSGSGTTNYIPKFTGLSAIGNSNLQTDASGNLGLGVTPSAWYSTVIASQINTQGAIFAQASGNYTGISNNYYVNAAGADKYLQNGYATALLQNNGQFQFYVAGNNTSGAGAALSFTQAMTLDASGRLGIGTTSPQSILHLETSSGNGSAIRMVSTSTNGRSYAIGSNFVTGNGEFAIYDYTASATRLWISSSGNVGIGTTNPTDILNLSYSNNNGGNVGLYVKNTNTGTAANYAGLYAEAQNGTVGFRAHATTTTALGGYGVTGTSTAHPLLFVTSDAERMRITSGGNVGIGTTSPQVRLDFGNVLDQAFHLYSVGVDYYGINMKQYDSGPYSTNIFSGDGGEIKFRTASGTSTQSTRMTISSTGNVGIGTTSPGNLLEIQGSTPRINIIGTNNGSNVGYRFQAKDAGGTTKSAGMYLQPQTGSTSYIGFAADDNNYQMIVNANGNVGIGTTSPTEKLQVSGNILLDAGYKLYGNANSGSTSSYVSLYNATDGGIDLMANYTTSKITFGTAASERMRITSAGEVYIAGTTDQGAYNLQVNGTGVWGAGAYVNGSDIRLKENIKEVGSALSLVNQLKPKTYTYKSSYSSDTATQVGFIAQDLEEVLKNEVYKNSIVIEGKEYKSVAYQNLIPLLVKAIQEQQIEIEKLKKQIK